MSEMPLTKQAHYLGGINLIHESRILVSLAHDTQWNGKPSMSKYSSWLQPTHIQMHTLMDSWGFHSSVTLDALAGMSSSRRMHIIHNSSKNKRQKKKKCHWFVVVFAWCITFFVLSLFFLFFGVKVLVSHLYTTYLKTGCRHYWVCSSWIRSNRTPHGQNWCLELWSCPLWTHYGSTPFGP